MERTLYDYLSAGIEDFIAYNNWDTERARRVKCPAVVECRKSETSALNLTNKEIAEKMNEVSVWPRYLCEELVRRAGLFDEWCAECPDVESLIYRSANILGLDID